MYNIGSIQDCLFSNVGLRQVDDPDISSYASNLLNSDSSLLVQNMHSLLTDENIDQSLPLFRDYNHPSWDISTTYDPGDTVSYQGSFYVALTTHVGAAPDASPSEWSLKDYKSEFLEELFKDSDARVLNKVFTMKKMRSTTKVIHTNARVFEGAGRMQDKEINRGDFVGLGITLKKQEGLKIKIDRVGLQFDGVESFNLYVYHSSQSDPIQTIPVTNTSAYNFNWTPQTIELKLNGTEYDSGGMFYIGYYQDDISGQAIIKSHDYSSTPCKSCSRVHWSSYNIYNRLVDLCPIRVPSQHVDPAKKLFDAARVSGVAKNNFGLNFSFQVECDLSDWICKNKSVLAEAQAKHRALVLLERIAYNTRDNGLAQKVKQMAQVELKGRQDLGMKGFHRFVEEDIKALSFDFSDLNSVCLPCERKGVKRRTA